MCAISFVSRVMRCYHCGSIHLDEYLTAHSVTKYCVLVVRKSYSDIGVGVGGSPPPPHTHTTHPGHHDLVYGSILPPTSLYQRKKS
jgi:hypothetical protein